VWTNTSSATRHPGRLVLVAMLDSADDSPCRFRTVRPKLAYMIKEVRGSRNDHFKRGVTIDAFPDRSVGAGSLA